MSENRLDKFKTALNGVKVPILVLDKKWYILRQKAGTTNEINALEKELKELLKRQGKITNDLNSLKKIKKFHVYPPHTNFFKFIKSYILI